MNYLALKTSVTQNDLKEILFAELAEVGFVAFEDNDNFLEGYITKKDFNKSAIDSIFSKYKHLESLTYEVQEIQEKNWNEEWEKNFQPVFIDDKCAILSSFHTIEKEYPYTIFINPKMSFGTGHHETTTLMLENQFQISHEAKKVLDLGCGTGILSILASKLGASYIEAYDIDEWAVDNTIENFELNGVENATIELGTVVDLKNKIDFDIILANINKNVLLEEMKTYVDKLAIDGRLLLSGFYEKDLLDIEHAAKSNNLEKVSFITKNEWVSAIFKKANA